MSEELFDELEEGQRAARDVVAHLRRMHGAQCTIYVIVEDERYEVTAKHQPVTDV